MSKQKSSINKEALPFRPRARLLKMLGDQLIGSHRLAVFELVKNAYDADADEVLVRINGLRTENPTITVEDNGEGMKPETIRNIWLVPADDHREKQKKLLKRTKKQRLPLGEKGLGRFAVHKLGDQIELVTRYSGENECVVQIDWSKILNEKFLSDALVSIETRQPTYFKGNKTGTIIKISELRKKDWSRGDIRNLYRQITSVSSPFTKINDFKANLEVPGFENYLIDLPNIEDLLKFALWRFKYRFKNGKLDWEFKFNKVPKIKINSRQIEKKGQTLLIPPIQENEDSFFQEEPENTSKKVKPKSIIADENYANGIGPIYGEFYVFDRDREVLSKYTNSRLISGFLDSNGGVRIYRDGIRVYNYGERDDDWLNLDHRRFQTPAKKLSRNILLGTVNLNLEHSSILREKTNREGFIENDAFSRLRNILWGIISILETERQIDKEKIRSLTGKGTDLEVQKIRKPLQELRKIAEKEKVLPKLEKYFIKLEKDYEEMQETFLHAGLSGLSLALIFHEVHRGVKILSQEIISRKKKPEVIEEHAKALVATLDDFSLALRRDPKKIHSIQKTIKHVRSFSKLRFEIHHVAFNCQLLDDHSFDFEARFSIGLVIGALNNILDNSFYWLRVRWPDTLKSSKPNRKIFIGSSNDFEDGPALIIADNGPGFQDDPERLIRPFFTRKPDGTGLGLYYAHTAMEMNGGKLLFLEPGDVELPKGFDGAIIALVFKRK